MTTRFDDGIAYAGTVAAILDPSTARVVYDDGEVEVVRFPDAAVKVTRDGPAAADDGRRSSDDDDASASAPGS